MDGVAPLLLDQAADGLVNVEAVGGAGQRLADLKALENLGELLFDTSSVLAHSNSWQGEFRSRRKNLEPYWGQLSISKVFNDDGMLTHYIGIYEDITRSKLAHQHIERLAYTDNLTNLGNRPAFIRSLEQRFAQNLRSLGLLLVGVGSGGLKSTAATLVGALYTRDDPRRDAGFSIYYMGINIGGLLGPLVTGIAQQQWERDHDLAKGTVAPKEADAVLQNAHLPKSAPGTMDSRIDRSVDRDN